MADPQLGPQTAPAITPNPQLPGGMDFGAIKQAPVPADTDALHSGENAAQIRPSRWDTWKASLENVSEQSPIGFMPDTTVGAIGRYITQRNMAADDEAAGVPKISADEANKRYPGLPLPFSEPQDPRVAQLRYDDFQRRQKLQDWISKGNPSGFQGFATGLAGAADPLNAGLMLATGGLSRAAGLSQNLRNVFLQNLGINFGTVAATLGQQRAEGQDIGLGEAAKGAIESAVGGTAFHFVVMHPLGVALEKYGPSWMKGNIETAIAQHETGSKTNVEHSTTVAGQRAAGMLPDGTVRPYAPVENVSTRPYYAAKTPEGAPAEFKQLGVGTHAVDNPEVANHASVGADGQAGTIGEVKVPEGAKLLDIEKPATESPEVGAALKEAGVEGVSQDGQTVKDVINEIQSQMALGEVAPDTLEKFQASLEKQGINGYQYVEDNGTGTPNHNGVMLFDKQVESPNVMQADPELVPKLTPEQKAANFQDTTSPSNNRYATPEIDKDVHDLKHGPAINSTPEYMDPIVKEQLEQAKARLTEMAKTQPWAKDALDELRRADATGKQEIEMLKQIAQCMEQSIL